MDTKDIISKLAKIESDAYAAIPDGWELPEALQIDFAPLVMDMLGVPQDSYDDETQEGFCRDWGRDQWMDVVHGDLSVDEFIARVRFDA